MVDVSLWAWQCFNWYISLLNIPHGFQWHAKKARIWPLAMHRTKHHLWTAILIYNNCCKLLYIATLQYKTGGNKHIPQQNSAWNSHLLLERATEGSEPPLVSLQFLPVQSPAGSGPQTQWHPKQHTLTHTLLHTQLWGYRLLHRTMYIMCTTPLQNNTPWSNTQLALIYTGECMCQQQGEVERQKQSKQVNYTQDSSFSKEKGRAVLGWILTHDTLPSRLALYQVS